MSVEGLNEEANELLLNDQYELALKTFSDAIEKNDKSNTSQLYTSFIGRSQANIKLEKYNEALKDAESAIETNSNDSRAYLKKGIAQYNLKQFEKALETLEEGQKKAEKESQAKRNLFNEWINKCQKEVKLDKDSLVSEIKTLSETVPKPPAIKYEWYQTESQVIVTILAKNVQSDDLNILSNSDNLKIDSKNEEKFKINFSFNLSHPIVADQTQIKYLSTKVEIKLKKTEALHWSKLEKSPNDIVVKKTSTVEVIEEKKPDYPSSSRKPKNWDKLVADVVAEEKDEKLEGDAALNKLFKQIYENGSDEVRKAMNKSFSESGGTVLSTNWTDVGAKKLDVKPPDGMEFKKWD
ncbi:unnamed protein product [Brachionus calyciflorus]|uniref:SGT1 n=1 Tax=Brachionus calyciflorus TaxID=104777 RepID=A0A814A5B5_9BILA|nr:unnamed protein product [Brachionus calyciflorus]